MALSDYIDSFESALPIGRQQALNKLLGLINQGESVLSATDIEGFLTPQQGPVTNLSTDLTTIEGYNNAITSILADLSSMYAESNNLWRILNSINSLSQDQIKAIRLAIEDLQLRVRQTEDISSKGITYTDSYSETFNAQTKVETNPTFYQNNTIQQAFVDTEDGLLKLPVDGEFINELSKPGIVPSNAFLNRCLGIPMGEGNFISNAFDGTLLNYWNEVIHSDSPIYGTQDQYPWLPSTYQGGAAVRIRVELENITQLSELDIRPYGLPINLLSIGYTNEKENYLTDPTFSLGIGTNYIWNSTNPYWFFNTTSNGGTFDLSGDILHITTTSASAYAYIKHTLIPIPMGQDLELSFLAKTKGFTPIKVYATYCSSGQIIHQKVEQVELDSLGWTKVILNLDSPSVADSVLITLGISVLSKRSNDIWIRSPRLETIKQLEMYEKIPERRTIFIPSSIDVKTLYLTFSQENYTLKHYSFRNGEQDVSPHWERLGRRINIDPHILSWDKDLSYNTRKVNRSYTLAGLQYDSFLSSIEGTPWKALQDISEKAFSTGDPITFLVYEYQMGAFEIYLRHREYAPQARYVSPPIRLNGEIREIVLSAKDRVYRSRDELTYTITATEDDIPEKGKRISNSYLFSSDLSQYPSPPGSINYLDYTSWVGTSLHFYPIQWPADPSNANAFTKEIVTFLADPNASPEQYVIRSLDTPLDLRGTASLSLEYYVVSDQQQYQISPIKLLFGFSNNNIDWVETLCDAKINTQLNLQTPQSNIIFTPLVLDLEGIDSSLKINVSYIRVKLVTPTYCNSNVYIMLRRLSGDGTNYAKTIRFWPSDDLPSSIGDNDFVMPVRKQTEIIDGTDRYGRAYLSHYPYINKTKVYNLINKLSSNLGGRLVGFDPNAANPKYLDSDLSVKTTEGYRPIKVSLYFPDTGISALPDSIGKPKNGDIAQAVKEVLTLASQSINTTTSIATNNFIPSKVSSTSSSLTSVRTTTIYQTSYPNLVSSHNGVSISCYWRNSSVGASGDILIDPFKVLVDPIQGLVEIAATPPAGYDSVVASYWFIVGETSLRENFMGPRIVTVSSSGSLANYPQSYPVTRNMTDYMTGTIPVLKPPVLDPLDSGYYPVFEYYVHSNGYLVFAQNMMKYSDTPAQITVEYDTLAIVPRLSIDITRPTRTNQTPWCDSYTLGFNVRRN